MKNKDKRPSAKPSFAPKIEVFSPFRVPFEPGSVSTVDIKEIDACCACTACSACTACG